MVGQGWRQGEQSEDHCNNPFEPRPSDSGYIAKGELTELDAKCENKWVRFNVIFLSFSEVHIYILHYWSLFA